MIPDSPEAPTAAEGALPDDAPDDGRKPRLVRRQQWGMASVVVGALFLAWGLLPAVGILPMLKALFGGTTSMDAGDQAGRVLEAVLARAWADLLGALMIVGGRVWIKRTRAGESSVVLRRARVALMALLLVVMASSSAFAGGLYAADYRVEATIVDKQCAGPVPPGFDMDGSFDPNATADPEEPDEPDEPEPGDAGQGERPNPGDLEGLRVGGENSTVTIRAEPLGVPFQFTVEDFPDKSCWPLRSGEDGNFITLNIRSERAIFYEREGGTCIYDTLFGLGCVLSGLGGLGRTDGTNTSASFLLSTSGYVADPLGLGLSSAPNCAVFEASDERHIEAIARWQATAADGNLRLRLQALDAAGGILDSAEATGPSALTANLDLPGGTATYTIAMFPEGSVGTTSGILVTLEAAGVTELPDAEPEPCL